MTEQKEEAVDVFIDLRSPYSYLALKPARLLEELSGHTFDWWPFVTDFRAVYGGEVEERSSRDVAKVKYLYMDCRRLAKMQGLTVRGTTKLWDPTLGCQAMLFAKSKNRLWAFCDPMLSAFWRREFDLESRVAVEKAIADAGLDVKEWNAYLENRAQLDMNTALDRAEAHGVFGAPTFVYKEELFWGGDRLGLLAEALDPTLSETFFPYRSP